MNQRVQLVVALALSVVATSAGARGRHDEVDIPFQWTKYENLPTVIGADGQPHTATCSGMPGSTNPNFFFYAKQGTAKGKVVVFFEGGGACWDAVTCSLPRLPGVPPQLAGVYKQEIPASDDPTVLDGLFNLSNPANPVKDWTFVYIPYCTGDVHLGSKDVTYQNVIGNPFVPASYTIHHRGSTTSWWCSSG